MRPTAEQLARTLGLEPHPEGGYFRETYRSPDAVQTAAGARPACTAILFLVAAGAVSRLHRLASDELWVFQGGDALELSVIAAGGELQRHLLGVPAEGGLAEGPPAVAATDLVPQALVPAGSWQGARLAGAQALPADRCWALVSCVVSPGFDYADFELGSREALTAQFPQLAGLIETLT